MKRAVVFLALVVVPWSATAQAHPWSFPRDHGTHEAYKTEWWYFTGHLRTQEGRTFGFQWTVFRNGLDGDERNGPGSSAWRARQIYLGHLAVSDLDNKRFYYFDNAFRAALGLAGGLPEGLSVRLPRFRAHQEGERLSLTADGGGLAFELSMILNAAPVLHGDGGFSKKSADGGNFSYYYSLPQLRPSGNLTIGGEIFDVSGTAWMDHEFSSGQLSKTQTGWDWMGLPLSDKSSLMIYRLRDERGPAHDYLSGTYVDEMGTVHPLEAGAIRLTSGSPWKSPRSGARYPLAWEVEVPAHGISLKVRADLPDQELDTFRSTQVTYWEGSVSVAGTIGPGSVNSRGYLEMTGYAERLGL
jgi:predicted secreted hydrolase